MPRPARRYSRRIEIWSSTPTSDGFAGNTLVDALVKTLWGEAVSLDEEKSTLNGIERGVFSMSVYCRKDPGVDWDDETLFLMIGGKRFRIISKADVDLDGIEIRMVVST